MSLRAAASAQEWVAKARKAEDLGFDIALVADHVAAIFPPMVALTAIATATKRIRVGTMVLNNDFHHPVLLAREAAALDLLSEGRFELGIGAGHAAEEYAGLGRPYDPGPVRAARLAESIGIMKRMLAGEEVTHDGGHYHVQAGTIFPAPLQLPVPLCIGGNSAAVLRLAAREATTVGFTGFFSATGGGSSSRLTHFAGATLENRLALVRQAAGERFDALELSTLVQSVTPTGDPAAAAEALTKRMPSLSVADILSSPFLLFGTSESMLETLLQRREQWGLSYFVVFEPFMDALAPVVAALAGR